MKFPKLKALGLGIGLFVAVCVPAFTTAALPRPRIEIAIPLIIAITLLVALLLMFLLARSPAGFAEFGFRIPQSRYMASATVFGLTVGLGLTFLSHLLPSKPPFDVSRLCALDDRALFSYRCFNPGGDYFSRPDSIY